MRLFGYLDLDELMEVEINKRQKTPISSHLDHISSFHKGIIM